MRWMFATLTMTALVAAPAQAAQWVKLTESKNGAIVLIDNQGITRDGTRITAPVKWDYAAVAEEKDPVEIDVMVFDCANETFNLTNFTYYDKAGNVTRKGKGDRPGMVPVPEKSIARDIFDRVCKSDT